MKTCKNCKYWQRGRDVLWADCYRVIIELSPQLENCTNDFGNAFSVPFDPHDSSLYFKYNKNFKREYKQLRTNLPKKVRTKKAHGLYFIQTREDYTCAKYDLLIRHLCSER